MYDKKWIYNHGTWSDIDNEYKYFKHIRYLLGQQEQTDQVTL